MKKLALSAILGASLMVTSSAFALTSMTDSNMKAATGQAGVSIAIDNVVIESYTGSTSYTDSDGVFGADGASIVIGDKHTIKTYLALTSAADFHKDFTTAMGKTYTAAAASYTDDKGTADTGDDVVVAAVAEKTYSQGAWYKAAALSIDVGTCAALTAGMNDNFAKVSTAAATDVQSNIADLATAYAAYTTAKSSTTATAADIAAAYATVVTEKEAAIADVVAAGHVDSAAEAAILLKGALGVIGKTIGATAVTSSNVSSYLKYAASKVSGVVIGLPTLLIKTTADTYSVGVANDTAINNGQNFITINKGIGAMAILGGTIEIAAH